MLYGIYKMVAGRIIQCNEWRVWHPCCS